MNDRRDAQDSEELAHFFDESLELLALADRGGSLRNVNPAWETVLGWSSQELLAQPFISFVHPDDVAATQTELATIADGADTVGVVNRYRCKDGSYRRMQWSFAVGESGTIYTTGTDVTEFHEALSEAQDNEELWRAVLRTTVDPIVMIDPTGTILRANESTTTMFGYPRAELVGANVSMLMPEPYRSEHDGYLARYLETGEARIIGIGREVEAQRADGSTFPMALAVSEARVKTGRVFTGVIHDLSDRHAAEKILIEANDSLEQRVQERTVELERSNRDLQQFAYIASHDLQAPLRNVRQGLELLDDHLLETVGTSFDAEANELRGLVVGAVTRMEDLIQGLLSYSQVQRQSTPLTDVVDLADVVDHVSAQLRLDLEAADAQLSAGDLPTVRGDATQLRQLLQNLVQNAIKYRFPDRRPEIVVSASESDDRWLISVRDNGVGVDEDHHERIFELFRRGHPGYDGVGIGLAICQRIVERHGGDIWVDSEPNQGATFTFTLPSTEDTDG